ncbi:tetraacyldisaccharide 4'-kinase, partial [bacterium]|nr:tetraacyldisaccharide 4'-kinase [bacterium]MBU1985010.1 tetraacyldisaccharide 4'-kinase [bacterium]
TKLSTPVFVLTSIARPSRFLNMLNKNGFNIVGQAAFRDHHLFTLSDIRRVIHRAESVGAQAIVTTVKDKIRLPDGEIALPIHVLGLTLEFDSERSVHALLEPILADLVKRSV